MRESYLMERYAQRAVDSRKVVDASRALANRAVASYLAEGEYLSDELKRLRFIDRMKYIAANSELIISSDGVEGINIVWCPNSQVLTHRLLSESMRKSFEGRPHYLGSWVRNVAPFQRDTLREELVARLEKRVQERVLKQNQLAIIFEEEDRSVPQFLQAKG
ncbi:hypothetical protein [Pseudomonas sp. NPDC089569]|uniref:hypothetical protein n=1 Tax=Pseudomonas sp. NPDC089569 TaxID=3390722 RepID=UPI003CFC240E